MPAAFPSPSRWRSGSRRTSRRSRRRSPSAPTSATALDARLAALHTAHNKISDKLTPIVDDSYFEVVTTAEDVGQSGDITVRTLIQGGMQVMQAMVEVGAETNLLTGLLTAGALTSSPSILAMLEDRFMAAARRAERQLAKMPAGDEIRAAQGPRARSRPPR